MAKRDEMYNYTIMQTVTLGTPCEIAMGERDSPDIPLVLDHMLTNAPCPGFVILTSVVAGVTDIKIGAVVDAATMRPRRNGLRPTLTRAEKVISRDRPLKAYGHYTGLVPEKCKAGDTLEFVVCVYGAAMKPGEMS
jgi:hypothetical protein